MKHRTLKLCVCLLALIPANIQLRAQSLSLPYFCGFESEAENAGWTMVNGTNANQWTIGSATAMKGTQSLYISSDGGATAGVAAAAGVSGVYKDFDLPPGKYEIAFDWKSQGGGGDTLLVAWVDDDPGFVVSANGNGTFPKNISSYVKTKLANTSSWQNTSIQVRVLNDKVGKLVFLFGKKTTSGINADPGACIDNIQIGSIEDDACKRPTDISVNTNLTSLEISWKGEAEAYDLTYKDTRGDTWVTVNGLTGTTHTINNPEAGVYTFWIRGVCGENTSIWSVYQYVIVTDATKNCINYIDLHSESVHTYYGSYRDPFEKLGLVDYGEEDYERSRHTVNIQPDRYDPNTGYQLRTIPEGDLASIRLGNPSVGAQAENITYDYVVDSASTIVLLNYAVVLENAHIGEVQDQSRFRLEVLDEDSVLISDCAKVDFVPEYVQDWNQYAVPGTDIKTVWKDWTAFGVDVSQYVGEKIKISLTTYDCKQQEHFGYAYFTLNCVPKTISGLTCGETPDSISAPVGFNYEWYHITDMNNVLSQERILHIEPNDTATYICRVISPEDPACYFEMEAVVAPKYPKAEATATLIQEDCQNKVQFENLSYVYTENGKLNEELDAYYWDFGDLGTSEEKNPLLVFDKPGTYPYSLHVSMVGGKCEDTFEGEVVIPEIGDVTDTLRVSICEGGYYLHDNKPLTTEGYHDFVYKLPTGCDSLFVIDLRFAEAFEQLVVDTVCFGTAYEFHGDTYTETGVYVKTYPSAVSQCDSTYMLDLTVLPEIKYEFSLRPALEGNDGAIIIEEYPENFVYYTLNGQENAPLENLPAGTYELTFFTRLGTRLCEKTETIEISSTCLELTVEEGPYETCADVPEIKVPYTIVAGSMKLYDVTFDDFAVNTAGFENKQNIQATDDNMFIIPMPLTDGYIRPGTYTADITFPGQPCDTVVPLTFTIYYPSSIVTQRWNDVLFLQNAEYNGGYSFSAYQWYKNDEAIAGETGSYLYVPEGLDRTAEYRVEVTRSDDGVTTFTCPVVPYDAGGASLTLSPNVLAKGAVMKLGSPEKGRVSVYGVSGVLVEQHELSEGTNLLQAPAQTGYYLLKVNLDNGMVRTFHLQVVE